MASGTDYEKNYEKIYGKAQTAYLQGNFEEAARIIDPMAQNFPNDPNILLLRGHICLGLQQYELAREQYDTVLELTDRLDLIDCANNGIEQISQVQEDVSSDWEDENNTSASIHKIEAKNDVIEENNQEWIDDSSDDWANQIENLNFENIDWDSSDIDEEENGDPTLHQQNQTFLKKGYSNSKDHKLNLVSQNSEDEADEKEANTFGYLNQKFQDQKTYQVDDDDDDNDLSGFLTPEQDSELEKMLSMPPSKDFDQFDQDVTGIGNQGTTELQPIYNDFNSNSKQGLSLEKSQELEDELEDLSENFDLFSEDLEGFPEFEDGEAELPSSELFNRAQNEHESGNISPQEDGNSTGSNNPNENFNNEIDSSNLRLPENVGTSFTTDRIPTVEVKQGLLSWFTNAPISKKHLFAAIASAIVSGIGVFVVTFPLLEFKDAEKTRLEIFGKRVALGLVASGTSLVTTFVVGQLIASQLKRYLQDWQNQFDTINQKNFNVKATIYSQDELGKLAANFNQMSQVILTTTTEAQRRAEETERAREDLQRQVIRLLDDVEGAARGDLTVQAEVTADVLGAVADAFNLTIQNLREIVRQVKNAAEQVNQGSNDSELFARNQSSDALRMAEELAVTLNSVQMMTDSIQRVAESAREAEEVARSSSVTALRGGEAVERTVAGILQIRETVSETTRKVKRLAEASQEISKIVAVISQIATRTNLLALNASIQAARAGEAGRGFAIVADEVRQLADRSAKSLQEIEQIVLQIQSETGSVMSAMEEGLQEVLDVTERAEQAKRSLEDIIQVSNRIDALVRSITADTVEQRENSRAVAQVMQSVELTAQETSQESQRVAGSLQKLVNIAQNLLESVKRFRVDAEGNTERK